MINTDITTERLLMRPLRNSDREDYVAMNQDPLFVKWLRSPTRIERLNELFDESLVSVDGTGWRGICLRENDKLIGLASAFRNSAGQYELKIFLKPESRKQGIAREALAALAQAVLEIANVGTVVVDKRNKKAVALVESLGFERNEALDDNSPEDDRDCIGFELRRETS